jgi:hypothetical protein
MLIAYSYNSAIFATITAREYMVFSANEAFVDSSAGRFSVQQGMDEIQYYWNPKSAEHRQSEMKVMDHMFSLAHTRSLELLDGVSCVNAYAQPYQVMYGNLLLVVSNTTKNYTTGAAIAYEARDRPAFVTLRTDDENPSPFYWIGGDAHVGDIGGWIEHLQTHIQEWQPFGKQINYCLAEKLEQNCRLEYSAHLVLVVLLMGLLKMVVVLYIALKVDDVPLLTIGDTVSSFLHRPEAKTEGMCLLERRPDKFAVRNQYPQDTTELGQYTSIGCLPSPLPFKIARRRNFSAASRMRRVTFGIAHFFAISTATLGLVHTTLFAKNLAQQDMTFRNLFGQGFGTVDQRLLFSYIPLPSQGVAGLFVNVMFCNMPQVALSLLYLNYNGLMTDMSLAREWSLYGTERKGLRVSTVPEGFQKSKYFLQLPYRYGIPILVVTGILHWLVSQSMFFVSILTIPLYECDSSTNSSCTGPIWYPMETQEPYMTGGYSRSGILSILVVMFILIVWIVVIGSSRLPSSMPLVSSCSAAIAAACHVLPGESGQSTAKAEVMWGALGDDREEVGHCGFSMYEVRQPVEGRLYA